MRKRALKLSLNTASPTDRNGANKCVMQQMQQMQHEFSDSVFDFSAPLEPTGRCAARNAEPTRTPAAPKAMLPPVP